MTDYLVGDTIYGMFTTRALTGVPTVLAGTPVVQIYENDSATQITAGITLGVSHDSIVGMNLLTIVATGANGFEAGKDYNVMLSAGTVDSVSVVGEVVWSFSLGRSAATQKASDVETDTQNIQSRIPAALVTGRMSSDAVAISGGTTAADNLQSAADNYSATRGLSGTALPAAAADAAGGLAISDAGGLDLDALNVNINDIETLINALNDISSANVNTEVSDVLKTDTIAELAQGAPATTPTFEGAIMRLYMALTKLIDIDAGFKEFYDNAGTVIWKKAVANDGTNYTEAKGETGP